MRIRLYKNGLNHSFSASRGQYKKEPLSISFFIMGLSGSLFISYIQLHQRVGLAMIQLECPASPFPTPDVVLPSSAQASRAISGVRMFVFHLFNGKGLTMFPGGQFWENAYI